MSEGSYRRDVATPEDIAYWDAEASAFDDAPDHGLHDPAARAAWRVLLRDALPGRPSRVADLGCGTGTLTLLLAEDGHRVDAVDVSPGMVEQARRKTGHLATVSVREGDAADPPLADGGYDVVLSRHVLWAMPDPAAALARWAALLAPGGRLVLVEGKWWTGAGLAARETVALVESVGRRADLRLLDDPVYWGGPITDERYVVTSLA